MPSKKIAEPRRTAQFNFLQLVLPKALDWSSIIKLLQELYARNWVGGLNRGAMVLRLFDPNLKDLSQLPLGLLMMKGATLPASFVPQSEADLLKFCRRLVHRGEDEQYVALMLQGWPIPGALAGHVSDLWQLRSADVVLFELIVRGLFGDALSHLFRKDGVGNFSITDLRAMIVRQELLWSANDVQITAARARVTFRRPLGKLLSGTMKIFKVGTALRLMHQAFDLLVIIAAGFQTTGAVAKNGPNGAKPEGVIAKAIEHKAKKHIEASSKPIEKYQTELDNSMPNIGGRMVDLRNMIAECETCMATWQLRSVEAGKKPPSNKLMMFHAMWYSGLSPAAGVMVACVRMAMAERYVAEMVDLAATMTWGSNQKVQSVDPLPALPLDPAELLAIADRSLALAYQARRTILRDEDFLSRLRARFSRDKTSAQSLPDQEADARDPIEKAGPFAASAMRFIGEMGGRDGLAHLQPTNGDDRVLTYYHMDVTPEERLRPSGSASPILR